MRLFFAIPLSIISLCTFVTHAVPFAVGDDLVDPQASQSNVLIQDAKAWSTEPVDGGLEIRHDGKLVTTYQKDLKGTPGFFPLRSPAGLELTRRFPIDSARPFEKDDHDHHRSVWFTHGIVNKVDFWIDDDKPHVGRIVERDRIVDADGDGLTLTTKNDWNDAKGKRVLTDERRFHFSQSLGDTVIDFIIRLNATDGDVTFGDTKEGTFGIRVAGSMKVDQPKNRSSLGGKIINAEGKTNADTWSQRSDWVNYSGPTLPASAFEKNKELSEQELLDAKWQKAGVTMMYDPSSDLPECRWHVRTYGLFAANPFARHDFNLPKYDGVTIKNGKSLTFKFRVVLHDGDFNVEKTKQHFADFVGAQ